MYHGPFAFRSERIGRLLDTVVEECVAVIQAKDESRANSLPQSGVYLLLSFPLYQAQCGNLGAAPETGEQSYCFLGHVGQAVQLAGHEIGDGAVHRAVAAAFQAFWRPPYITTTRVPSRWNRAEPRFDHVSKR